MSHPSETSATAIHHLLCYCWADSGLISWTRTDPIGVHVQERNESLFYYVLANNIEELLPVVHMPTVSHYCQLYGLMFRSLPRSLFISMRDKGGGHL